MLKKGDKAPDFRLKNTEGNWVSLEDYKGKWLVVYFYPKDNTPGCTKQAVDFSDLRPKFQALGVNVIGINTDSVESHQNFCKNNDLHIPLLSDPDKSTLNAYKVWGEKKFMNRIYTGLIRSTFIIAPDGTIAEALYNVKATGHGRRIYNMMEKIIKDSQ